MKIETIKISDINLNLAESTATLTCYINENSKEYCEDRLRKAVVICPGGGYEFTSDRENQPVAIAFLNRDIQAFVLNYSVAPARYPQQLLELAAAVSYVKSHGDEYYLNPEQVAVCGFSAGGHLAASLGTMWNEPIIREKINVIPQRCKPQVMILGYPVITSGKYAHRGSFEALLGTDYNSELLSYLSLERRVSNKTVPTYIWHTFEDNGVPCENSLLFATALKKHSIPFELTIYQHGGHGLSLCNEITTNKRNPGLTNDHDAKWFSQCIDWWENVDK